METRKILLVEDDQVDLLAFKRFVREGQLSYKYTIASSVAQARQLLAELEFDIVITDYDLGDGTALDLLRPSVAETPFIFVTGAGDEEIAVKAIQAGADDYIVKDPDRNYLKVLPITVDHVIQRRQDKRAAEQLRQDVIRMMVHDLRNPLGAISASLQLLETCAIEKLDQNDRQALRIALNNSSKMLTLINNILDVSQLESGQLPVKPAAVQLSRLVAQAFDSQAPLAIQKNLRLESALPPTLPDAWADAELVGRVLQNLVSNAIKFTPVGGLVRVAASAEEKEGPPVILISVSDNGPGLPPEMEGRLFEKFAKGLQREHGSGLGLAFCKLAIKAHGQRIWADSRPGQGVTFTFSLPTPPASVLVAPPPTKPELVGGT